jgi:uncharacterized membrane protein YhaH (DUF805 family)
MQNRNPYAAPRTNVSRADDAEDYGEINAFSPRGRIGRVRYIGYSTGLTFLIASLLGIAVAAAGPSAAAAVTLAGYVLIIAIQLLLTIQRAHDMNSSGWLAPLALIPLVSLLFWFVPGSQGENRYGKPPPPNTTGAVVLACLLPLVFVVGIVAAIAIPAYQDYAQRAAAESAPTDQR